MTEDDRTRSLERTAARDPDDADAAGLILARAEDPGLRKACSCGNDATPGILAAAACETFHSTVPVPESERHRWLAYCGHAGALRLAGWAPRCTYHERVAEWSPNCGTCPPRDQWSPRITTPLGWACWLSDLPDYLKTACALGAARLVLPGCVDWDIPAEYAPRKALDACAAWLRDPTEAARETWHQGFVALPGGLGIWIPAPVSLLPGIAGLDIAACERLHGNADEVHAAARACAISLLLSGKKFR